MRVGNEAKEQMLEAIGRQPDVAVACVGGGSNAIGLFYPYIEEENVHLVGVEAGGLGVDTPDHAAPITSKAPIGVLHGFRSYLMQERKRSSLGTSFRFRRLGLPRHRPGTQPFERHRPRGIHRCQRRRSTRSL